LSSAPAIAPAPHPLRSARFLRLWIGSGISMLGDQFYFVALPWVILQLTGSALAMSGILMAGAIPRAVLMLMGGVVSDRVSPRRIMLLTASTRTVLVATIGALLAARRLHPWELYFLSFGFGTADAFAMPAFQTYLPLIVEGEQLVHANSALQGTAQGMMIAGPAPAGIVVKLFGSAWAFFLDAVSFLAILAALWGLPDPPRPLRDPDKPKPAVWHSIAEGLRFVHADPPLWALTLMVTVLNFCLAGPISVGLPLLAARKFHSPTAFAAMLTSFAIGGILGAVLASVWKVRRKGWLMLIGSAILGSCLAAAGILARLWLVGASLVLMGISAGLVNLHIVSWIQQRVEAAMRGRVMSVLMFASVGLVPVSLAVAGAVAQWNVRALFLLAGCATAFSSALAARLRSLRDIGIDAVPTPETAASAG